MIFVGDYAPACRRVAIDGVKGLVVCNLEGPILPGKAERTPRAKAGPHLSQQHLPRCAAPIAFSLANNHIMDFGLGGLDRTIAELQRLACFWSGAGADKINARRPMILDDAGLRIGIICCCETQFGVATRTEPGTAAVGPWVYKAVSELAEQSDAVVLSIHAGFEVAPWPSPQIQDVYRSFIDAGASLVHGHHPHVPQGIEQYHGGLIMYGAGNFVVDPGSWNAMPNALWSIGLEVDFSSRPLNYDVLTFEVREQNDSSLLVRPSTPEESACHRQYLDTAQRPLGCRSLLEALWHETALRSDERFYRDYLQISQRLNGATSMRERFQIMKRSASMFVRAIRGYSLQNPPTRDDHLLWYHLFACQTHADAIATALAIHGGEIPYRVSEEARALVDQYIPSVAV